MSGVFTTIHIVGEKKELDNFKEIVKATIKVEEHAQIDGTYQLVTILKEVPFCFSSIIPIPDSIEKIDNSDMGSLKDMWMLENWGALSELRDSTLETTDKNHLTLDFYCGSFPHIVYLAMVDIFPSLHLHGQTTAENGEFSADFDGANITDLEPPRNQMEELAAAYYEEMGDDNLLGVTIEMDADGYKVSGILNGDNATPANDDITDCTFRMTTEEEAAYHLWNEDGRKIVNDESPANDDVKDPFQDTTKLGKP